MTTDQMAGLYAGIGGSIIGVMGGVIGTYFSIKNTNGPRERAFMVRCAAVMWLVVTTALTVAVLVPWGRFVGFLPLLFLAPVISRMNRAQERIRREEADEARSFGGPPSY
jgi:hypothetical protein